MMAKWESLEGGYNWKRVLGHVTVQRLCRVRNMGNSRVVGDIGKGKWEI